MVTSWRIATDTPDYEAHDLSGKGAEISGGRWNRKGRPVVYSASSLSLAALETAVHLPTGTLPLNRFVVRVDIPDAIWAARLSWDSASLPVGWSARPEGKVSLDVGDSWLASLASAILVVPSVVVAEEFNVLINPKHQDSAKITAAQTRAWFFDERLKK